MKNKSLKQLCKIYLLTGIFAYATALLLFAIFSPIPIALHISVLLFGITPFITMLIFVIRKKKAFRIVKALLPYIIIAKLTAVALISNGLESAILLFFFIVPFIIHSLDENIIIPTILIFLVISFFGIVHSFPTLYSALNKVNIIGCNREVNNISYAYLIFYSVALLISFIQSLYYVKTQNFNNRVIEQKNSELNREKQFKENLLINAAHEIRTPHTIIKNSLEELSRKYPQLVEDIHFLAITGELERVIREADNIFDEEKLNICENIYNHNKIFPLSSFLKEKALLFNSYAMAKGTKISIEGIEDSLYLQAAAEAIDKVVNNLLDNAIKYTPAGGNIEIIAKGEGDKIRLTIKDNGRGIPEKDIAGLFIRYYQATKRPDCSRGIGLGLYLVKKILDTLNAGIEIESVEHKGTAVHIDFKRHFLQAGETIEEYSISRPANIVDLFAEQLENRYDDSLQTILIVEDEPAIVATVRKGLEEKYNVITANNGKRAMQILQSYKVCLIISDIMMPLMNGLELCQKVKSLDNYKNIPFIFITARVRESERLEGLSLGAIDYISKPFSSHELHLKIENNLKIHRHLVEKCQTAIIDEFENSYKEKIAHLPPRLKQISDLLYQRPSITNREIAEILDLRLGSVGSYIKDLALKFELNSERKSEVIEFLRKYRNS